jgi:preprotein translocase subunit SecD
MRELQVSKQNVGGRVGIVLDGTLVAAPEIPGPSRLLFIDGKFTEARAREVAEAFNEVARRTGHSR